MTEQERIEALVEEGRITREQTDSLLAVLAETAEAEAETESVSREAEELGGGQHDAEASEAWKDSPLPAGTPDGDGKWLDVRQLAGSVRITALEGLAEPELKDGALDIHAGGARYQQWGNGNSTGFLDRLLGGVEQSDALISIPAGWGVRLDARAGEVTISGRVGRVEGQVSAGECRIEEATGIDLGVGAGEVRAGLRLAEGEHRVNVKVGSMRLDFLPGTDVEVQAKAAIGSVRGVPTSGREWGPGSNGKGRISVPPVAGGGSARLDARVTTGDVRLGVRDE